MEWNQEQFYSFEKKRGVCKGFSFGSRRRMLDRLNQISVASDTPTFVTLTLPDDCFQDSVAKFAQTAKLHLDVLLKRLRRACPSACGFWRIEWKARKSGKWEGKLFPHFHLLVWGLPLRSIGDLDHPSHVEAFIPLRDSQFSFSFSGLCQNILANHVFKSRAAGEDFLLREHVHNQRSRPTAVELGEERSIEETYMSFFDWVSLAWYHVVGSGNTDHFFAGCSVEQVRTWGGVLSYCAKYMSKADAENFMEEIAVGRSWGIFNRGLMPWAKMVSLDLSDDVGNRVRRIARRYLEHRLGKRVQRHYGLTLYCDTAKFVPLFARPPDTPF